jgi:nitrogen fixation NifU-like protein
MYNETVMNHFQNPRNTGKMSDPDGVGEVGNPACGDVMRLFIKVENDRLSDIKCQTFGCAAAIACASAASEMMLGKSLDDASNLTRAEVAEYLDGLPEQKMACSNLAPDAVRAAIENYRTRNSKNNNDNKGNA